MYTVYEHCSHHVSQWWNVTQNRLHSEVGDTLCLIIFILIKFYVIIIIIFTEEIMSDTHCILNIYVCLNKCGKDLLNLNSDPVVSSRGLCVQHRLCRSLDGHRFVSTDADVATLWAMPLPPLPGEKRQMVTGQGWISKLSVLAGYIPLSSQGILIW